MIKKLGFLMCFNRLAGIVSLLLLSPVLFAQQNADVDIVEVKGNITDYLTHKPVNAKIQYESLPYGSKIGIFSGSEFSFSMEDGNDYRLKVIADGYAPYSIVLKSAEFPNGNTSQTIELKPTGVDQLIRLEKLIFALGRAEISEESHSELDDLVTMLNSNENINIQLEGHTDFRGNPRQNMRLSEKRVQAVKAYLVRKGIHKKRIDTKAFGGTQPLSRSGDDDARRANRRVEVRILSN